jgi:hypothetical protein
MLLKHLIGFLLQGRPQCLLSRGLMRPAMPDIRKRNCPRAHVPAGSRKLWLLCILFQFIAAEAEDIARDDEHVYLAGSLEDIIYLAVAHPFL